MKGRAVTLWVLLLVLVSPAGAEPVRVGVLLPLTGAFQRYGERIAEGLRRTAPPGIELVIDDEACDPKTAVTAFRKLRSVDGVRMFLGPWCGSPQSAVAPLLKQTGAVAILGSSAPENVFQESGKRMYSTQAAIEEESEYNAGRMDSLGVKSVVIVFKENGFSRAHEAAFRRSFHGSIAGTLTYTAEDAGSQKEIVLSIRRLKPEALYVPDAWPLLNGLLRELKNSGLGATRVFSVYSAQAPDVLASAVNEGFEDRLVYSYPDLGAGEALDVFPKRALEVMSSIVSVCGGDAECAAGQLEGRKEFGEKGTLKSIPLVWKTVRNGAFVKRGECSPAQGTC